MSSQNEETLSTQTRILVARIHRYFVEEKQKNASPAAPAPPAAPGDALQRCAAATGLPENLISQVILHRPKEISQNIPYMIKYNEKFGFQEDRVYLISKSTNIGRRHKTISVMAKNKIPAMTHLNTNIKKIKKIMNCYEDNTGYMFIEKTKYRLKLINYLRFSKCAVSQLLIYTFVGELVFSHMSYVVAFAASGEQYMRGSLQLRPLAPRAQDDIYDFVLRDLETSWLSTKVIPKKSSDSIVIMMNESVYKKALRGAPGARSGAAAMRRWLAAHGVPAPEELRAPQLFELVRRHKASFVETEYGVRLYKIPDYLPCLNPLNIMWHEHIDDIDKNASSKEDIEREITRLLESLRGPRSMSNRFYNVLKAEYNLLEQQDSIDRIFKDNRFENWPESESESESSDDEDYS